MRRLLALAGAAVLAASPAAAQSAQELLGRYPLEVDYEGPGCPADTAIDFEVRAIRGGTIEFVVDGETDEAAFHGPSKSFRKQFETATAMSGRFTRRPDSIRLDIEWTQNGCTAHMAGLRPAAPLPVNAMPASPTTQASAAPPAAAAPAPGAAQAPPSPAASDLKSQLLLYGPLALLLLVAGAVGGWFIARRRKSGD